MDLFHALVDIDPHMGKYWVLLIILAILSLGLLDCMTCMHVGEIHVVPVRISIDFLNYK